ncbi:MAG: RHS repeat-associated core domain-containing protein, partial [Bdellovibrionales bacterium]|nr:RHS repeat-associated core domain-containing protein [Bdellovibrionales bacterium]
SVGSNYSATQAQDPLFGWMAPYENESSYSIVNSPINIHESVTKSAILSDPNNPFSFTQLTTTQTLQNDPARTSKTIYNTSDRTLTSISPMNRVMQQKLSDHGDVSELKIGSLESIKFDYDSRGRIKNIQQGARITNFSYDSLGNVSSAKDSLGHETQYSYDLAGRIIKKTLSNGNEIRFRYDKNGNLIGLTPPSKQEHTFVYNLFELVTEYLPPELANGLLTETKYTYDLGSKLTQITRPDGLVVKLNYNSNTDLLTSINTPAGDYTYSYIDQSSLVKQAKSPYGQQLDYGYFGKVLASETTTGLVNSSLSYDYNTDGSLKSYSVGNQIVNSTYDNDKLLTGIGSLQLERNDFGAISKVKLQRLEGTYAYSSLGELKKQTYKYRGRTLSDESYDRDNLGRIIKIKSQFPRTQEGFEYDQQGRLVRVYHRNHLVRVYQYDDNGNRVKKWENGRLITADYDSQDRLIRYGNKRYEYNNNGDLSAVIENDRFHEKWHESKKEKHHNEHGKFSRNNKTNYKYDVFGNLVSVEFANGRKIEYLIDAQNRRVGKKVNGKLEVGYVYNGKTQIVAELDSQGNIVKQFIYGSKMNTPDYMIYKNKEYAIISDQVGTPEYLVDANTGGYREVYYYDEFGNTQREDHRISLLPFGFAGGLYDKDTGLVRFGARDYNPTIGRWTTKDPIGFNGGDTNLFGYVQNDPVNWIDPMGLFKLPKDPSGLGPGWKQDPNHTPGNGGGRWHYKGGKRFLEFHPGKPGAGGK